MLPELTLYCHSMDIFIGKEAHGVGRSSWDIIEQG